MWGCFFIRIVGLIPQESSSNATIAAVVKKLFIQFPLNVVSHSDPLFLPIDICIGAADNETNHFVMDTLDKAYPISPDVV